MINKIISNEPIRRIAVNELTEMVNNLELKKKLEVAVEKFGKSRRKLPYEVLVGEDTGEMSMIYAKHSEVNIGNIKTDGIERAAQIILGELTMSR